MSIYMMHNPTTSPYFEHGHHGIKTCKENQRNVSTTWTSLPGGCNLHPPTDCNQAGLARPLLRGWLIAIKVGKYWKYLINRIAAMTGSMPVLRDILGVLMKVARVLVPLLVSIAI